MAPSVTRSPQRLDRERHRPLIVLMAAAGIALLITVVTGALLERSEHTPLIRVGQVAPDFTLPASQGGSVSLSAQRGHPVVLAFVPSVQCGGCKQQLRTLEAALLDLTARQIAVFAISTDEPEVQETVRHSLHLSFPFLAEDVVINRHPAGHAFGLFHLSGSQQGPVDANAVVVIDAQGIVRAVDARPAGQLTATQLVALVTIALDEAGGTP